MNARELFQAIGDVDDDLILAADEPPARPQRNWRPVLFRAAPLAACLCLVVGAVLWQKTTMKGTAAPDTAAAVAPEAALQESAGGSARSDTASEEAGTAQAKAYDGLTALYNEAGESLSVLPAALADRLDTGSGPYTLDTSPLPADRARLSDWMLPDTVTVYRSMAAARTIDTSGMYGRIRSMLQALGLDTTLADSAVYTGLTQEEADEQAAVLRQNGGSERDELQFWADAAGLTLEVSPCEAWPDGLTLTADNTGTVTAQTPGTETAATQQAVDETARTVQADWPGVAALAGQTPVAMTYTGTDGGWHVQFYDSSDTATGNIEAGALNSVEVAADADGRLCRVVWHNADLTRTAGTYSTLTRAEAEDLLTQDLFLTDGGSLDGAGVLENLAYVHLRYTESRDSAWYLPYWCFTADEGSAASDGTAHTYCEYLVPAISLQDLNSLADAD